MGRPFVRFRQSGATRWLVLALAAGASLGLLAAGLGWSAPPVALASPHGGVIDFTPDGTQPGLNSLLDPPSSCLSCHRSFDASSGAGDFMPHNTWGGSMMAHATRDPLFWAALDVANNDIPGVGDYCLRCHTPAGWLEGRVAKTGTGGRIAGENGCQLTGDHDDFEFKGNDFAGLTCHFCHRMTETGPNGEVAALQNGNFWIDDATSCVTPDGTYGGPCRHGPYSYELGDVNTAPHGWVYSEFHDRGAICGTCHDVSTPITSEGPAKTLILPTGMDSGIPMPVERTFTEWAVSDFADVIYRDRFGDDFPFNPQLARGATCQDCHMPTSVDPTARACNQNVDGSRTGNLPVHEFVGANTWVPAIIRDEYAAGIGGGVEDRVADLNRTIASARDMLTQRSATIQTTVQPYVPGSNQLNATVRITNLAGHKLPTGYAEGRRMYIHVVARNAANQVIWENAAWNPATGALSQDAQTKIYETLQGIWNPLTQTCEIEDGLGRKQFHFVLNNCIAKDNRIPPLGFAGGDDLETRPVNYSYPVVPGTTRSVNYDDTAYVIPLPPGTSGAVTVTATLRFQIASEDYITFLRDQAVENNFLPENTMCSTGPGRPFDVGPQDKTRGQFLYDLWSDPAYGRSPPEDMVAASAVAPVSG
jgi:hypothetical protein